MTETDHRAVASDWFERSFGALYPIIYAHRTVDEAGPEAAFAAARLRLRTDGRLLDVGCGNGRHLHHLSRRASVTGLDFSPELLAIARRRAPSAGLVQGDMRALPFSRAFGFLTNFFTSFGYFLDEDENEAAVQSLASALQPGGRFFVDYFCAEHARRHLCPRSVRHVGAYEIHERRWINERDQRLNKETRVFEHGTCTGRYGESLRLYEPEAFAAMFAAHGMVIEEWHGDYEGNSLSFERPRMIAVGTLDAQS